MKNATETDVECRSAESAARPLAPEDVRTGDYVAVLHIVGEHLTCAMLEDSAWRGIAPVRIAWLPCPWEENPPLRVVGVCLPFLLVKDAEGKHKSLDVRRYRLARVSDRYARKVRKKLRKDKKRLEAAGSLGLSATAD